MDSGDFSGNFKIDFDRLKYLGISFDKNDNPWFKVYIFIAHVTIMGIYNTSLLIHWIFFSKSIKEFAFAGYIILTCIQGQSKLLTLARNRKEVKMLFTQFKDNYFYIQSEAEKKLVNNELLLYGKIKIGLYIVSIGGIVFTWANPIFNNRNNGLATPAWYPINVTYSPVFEIAALHQDIAIGYVGFGYFTVDIVLSGTLTFIGMQCNILSLRFKNLNKIRCDKTRHRILVDAVNHHRNIIRFLKTTDKVFGNIYFWQLFASTTTLCMNLFLMSVTDPTSFEFYYLIVYLMAVSNLLLVPCWFASEMTRKSENISLAAYKCDWIDANNSFKKELIYFIHRSQQPLKLYAASFFEISVETFIKIIRASLSYFAVLNNLNK